MLFDERDLNIFDSIESRKYFKEILQSYYSQNYRATIVMLYSFVIYDLLIKLQTMANEGDKKAKSKVESINKMIDDDEKYSKVENKVINFYKENSPLYFDKFVEDIEYLKNCRNKCAHLKINNNSLFEPNDYHARMLICSMYDNVLSVKAPFIMDLFSIANPDVELYASTIFSISNEGLDVAINENIKNKYLKRMTFDSIKKSYKTFIRLLFVSNDENCKNNAYGLYAFTYALSDYIVKEGFTQIYQETDVIDIFNRIDLNLITESSPRRNALISIITKFTITMDLIKSNTALFDYVSKKVLLTHAGISMYRLFYPREPISAYSFFLKNRDLKQPYYTEEIYTSLKDCEDFDIDEYMIEMVTEIPCYNGFSTADYFMESLITHINDMSLDALNTIMGKYNSNSQCTNRSRHKDDLKIVNTHIKDNSEKTESKQ